MKLARVFLPLLIVAVLAACSPKGPRQADASSPFERLSEYGFFIGRMAELIPAEGVLPYDVNTPLFSDYAEKARFVWMPPGLSARYVDNGPFEFPIGTAVIKNFYYPLDARKPEQGRKLMETRLLLLGEQGWEAWPYIWNEEQTEAYLEVAGGYKKVSWVDEEGESFELNYVIPNKNQCKNCHDWTGSMQPIGLQAKHLHKEFQYLDGPAQQVAKWREGGYLRDVPALEEIPALAAYDDAHYSLDLRARAYLDINCGHCHNPKGNAKNSGLGLLFEEQNPTAWGVNKPPVAAGRGAGNRPFSIVAGHPDQSILLYRIESVDPGVMMPELGRKLVHKEGIALIREWIEGLEVSQEK